MRSSAEASNVVALRPDEEGLRAPAPACTGTGGGTGLHADLQTSLRAGGADARAGDAVHALLAACEARVASGGCRYALSDDARFVSGRGCACGPEELRERPVQLRGSALAQGLLRLAGWRVRFDGLPARQGVLVVYPHTSNWDFVWGMLAKWAIGLPLVFWGKDALFRVPLFGRWLRWIGGLPVDRGAAQGIVGETAARLQAARDRDAFMWLGLAPEGTRRRTEGWRSGFYHVATQARVPVALAFIDYAQREIGVDSAWQVHGNAASDLACFATRLARRTGRIPGNAAPVRLR